MSCMCASRYYDRRPCDANRVREMLNLLLQRCDLLAQCVLYGLDVSCHGWWKRAYTSKPLGSTVEPLNT